MSQKIQIICSSPGMRRHGVEHPASKIYDASEWTKDEIAAFNADPAFTVIMGTAETGAQIDASSIEAAVAARVEAKAVELQASFNTAVADAVATKVAEVKADHDNALDAMGKRVEKASADIAATTNAMAEKEALLLAANDKIADLETQLADAKKASGKAGK